MQRRDLVHGNMIGAVGPAPMVVVHCGQNCHKNPPPRCSCPRNLRRTCMGNSATRRSRSLTNGGCR
eukprot:9768885-Lingulodinium_polyedra.AAC.1